MDTFRAPGHLPASESPRISVVIPVRNDRIRLRQCLESLQASRFREFETIVVDDGSGDGTPEVAKAFGACLIRLEASGGPGNARNRGVEAALAPVVHFIDSDCCAHPDTLARVAAFFASEPAFDAIFGSYDLEPGAGNLISQYKNLFHRYVHQTSRNEASTFWTGCGAIRVEAFRRLGGFDTGTFRRPSIEDIDLGVRLRRAGGRIWLDPALQVKHLKQWRLLPLVRCEFVDRGVPWTRLILRSKDLPSDLNFAMSQRLSAALTGLLLMTMLVAAYWSPALPALGAVSIFLVWLVDRITQRFGVRTRIGRAVLLLGAASLVAAAGVLLPHAGVLGIVAATFSVSIVTLNRSFYQFFIGHRGWAFAILIVPLHLLYYLYSSAALATGIALHLIVDGRAPRSDPKAISRLSTLGTITP